MKYLKNISAGTITRTLFLVLALINQVLAVFGKPLLNITEDEIGQAVSIVWTTVATVVAWWKNNSFTTAAIMADQLKVGLKNGIFPEEFAKKIITKMREVSHE